MAIVCDSRKRRSGLPARLAALGVAVSSTDLGIGDYAIGPTALVERKSVGDLGSSVIGGRFWRQLGRLRIAVLHPYLLVEGADLDAGPLDRNSVRGCLVAALDLGVRLVRTTDTGDTALWLQRLDVWHGGARTRVHKPAYAQRPKAAAPAAVAEAALAAVPGISSTLAAALLRHFGSLEAVLTAPPQRWREVQGIGAARADALAAALAARRPAAAHPTTSCCIARSAAAALVDTPTLP